MGPPAAGKDDSPRTVANKHGGEYQIGTMAMRLSTAGTNFPANRKRAAREALKVRAEEGRGRQFPACLPSLQAIREAATGKVLLPSVPCSALPCA